MFYLAVSLAYANYICFAVWQVMICCLRRSSVGWACRLPPEVLLAVRLAKASAWDTDTSVLIQANEVHTETDLEC